jgi:hypothetical protein
MASFFGAKDSCSARAEMREAFLFTLYSVFRAALSALQVILKEKSASWTHAAELPIASMPLPSPARHSSGYPGIRVINIVLASWRYRIYACYAIFDTSNMSNFTN